jgi:hypothetical protein
VLIRTAATIYKNDSTQGICSADPNFQLAVTPARCYNASWIYYSFDDCDPPGSSPSETATSQLGGSYHAGAIVGGIVVDFLVLAGLGAGVFWHMRRKKMVLRNSANIHIADGNQRYEMHSDNRRMELPANPHLETFSELGGSRPLSLKVVPIEVPTEYHADIVR